MIIVPYESRNPDTPPRRRWLAQIEQIKGRLYITFHGATEAEAMDKAQKFWDTEIAPKNKSKGDGQPEHEPEPIAVSLARNTAVFGDLM